MIQWFHFNFQDWTLFSTHCHYPRFDKHILDLTIVKFVISYSWVHAMGVSPTPGHLQQTHCLRSVRIALEVLQGNGYGQWEQLGALKLCHRPPIYQLGAVKQRTAHECEMCLYGPPFAACHKDKCLYTIGYNTHVVTANALYFLSVQPVIQVDGLLFVIVQLIKYDIPQISWEIISKVL